MKRTIALAVIDEQRPVTRGDCVNGPRPCSRVLSCRQSFYEVEVKGPNKDRIAIGDLVLEPDATEHEKEQFTDALAHRMSLVREWCALDIADREPDGATLELVGVVLEISRERVRQIESAALKHMPRAMVRNLGVQREELHEPTAPQRVRTFRRTRW